MKVVLSGCSGGGKSTLLELMRSNGFPVFAEPGRQIVKEQLSCGGNDLPWKNPERFAELCIDRSLKFYSSITEQKCPVIYDRSFIDAISALEHLKSDKLHRYSSHLSSIRYHEVVYFTPPWKEIYSVDKERKHSFEDSLAEYKRLVKSYTQYGYKIVEIPKTDRSARLEFLKSSILTDWSSSGRA